MPLSEVSVTSRYPFYRKAADQKPGDIVMAGGFKLNIKDAEKLKGLLPK